MAVFFGELRVSQVKKPVSRCLCTTVPSESEPVEHPPCSGAQLPVKPAPWSGQRTNGRFRRYMSPKTRVLMLTDSKKPTNEEVGLLH